MVTLYLVVSFLVTSCSSGPIPRDSHTPTVGWVSGPNGRGTLELILSCLLTLGLCVWNAMHLNIPAKGETRSQYWVRSLKWGALGVLIPELVVLSAWRQWLSARRMQKELQEIFDQHASEKRIYRRFKWTIAHSYFAGMGGFVFETQFLPQGEGTLFNSQDRLTLTASGVLLLARCGHLPDIDRESIWDKSKADGLAKAIVCLQAAWMVLQIMGRLAAHQSITLLEVNTIGHILCAFVIYLLWWRKPKEVKVPTILEGDWTGPIAAYMFMSSRISGRKPSGLITLNQWIKPELSELAWYPLEFNDNNEMSAKKSLVSAEALNVTEAAVAYSNGELRPRPERNLTELPTTVVQHTTSSERSPDQTRTARLKACTEAIQRYPPIRKYIRPPHDNSPWRSFEAVPLVVDVATNWPSDYYLPGIKGELMGMALWLSSSLYGGIHLTAWSEFFPTTAEQLLWRFSAIMIAASGLIWLSACIIALRWPWAGNYWDRFIELRAWKIEYALWGFVATVCGVGYLFARVFLVVDAIVSLRRMPNTAYETPDWTSIFPHL